MINPSENELYELLDKETNKLLLCYLPSSYTKKGGSNLWIDIDNITHIPINVELTKRRVPIIEGQFVKLLNSRLIPISEIKEHLDQIQYKII